MSEELYRAEWGGQKHGGINCNWFWGADILTGVESCRLLLCGTTVLHLLSCPCLLVPKYLIKARRWCIYNRVTKRAELVFSACAGQLEKGGNRKREGLVIHFFSE